MRTIMLSMYIIRTLWKYWKLLQFHLNSVEKNHLFISYFPKHIIQVRVYINNGVHKLSETSRIA